jgi:hypothetical protein
MTGRLTPLANSMSIIGRRSAGAKAQGDIALVSDSAATRFWPYRCETEAAPRMSAIAVGFGPMLRAVGPHRRHRHVGVAAHRHVVAQRDARTFQRLAIDADALFVRDRLATVP